MPMPKGYCTNLDEFCVLLNQQKPFTPFGDLLHCYSSQAGLAYEVYKVSLLLSIVLRHSHPLCSPVLVNLAHTGFRAYHARLQPMLLWFIEAASLIGQV